MSGNPQLTIIDYGMGNIASVNNMIRFIGGDAKISASEEEVRNARKLILPGVGSYDAGIKALKERNLDKAIQEAVENGAYLLGICLGMQLFMESSEEGTLSGLALVPGKVKRFHIKNENLRVPHMGWNEVEPVKNSLFFNEMSEEQRFYFVHSYHVECRYQRDVTGITQYGYNFTSSYEHDRILGVQFHPEKSHRFGMNIFKKFLEI